MSAYVLQTPMFVRSEADILLAVGAIACTSDSAETALLSVKALLLRLPGITAFQFEVTGRPALPGTTSAVAPVLAGENSYGQVRLFFDPKARPEIESPIRLARFLGQQLGLLLNRLALQRQRQGHYVKLNALTRNIRRRKALYRASAILAKQREVSQSEAISLIVKYARQTRRPVLQIVDSLIFGYNHLKASTFHVR